MSHISSRNYTNDFELFDIRDWFVYRTFFILVAHSKCFKQHASFTHSHRNFVSMANCFVAFTHIYTPMNVSLGHHLFKICICLFLWLTFTLVLSTQGGDSFLSCASVFFFQCVWTSNWTRGFGYWIRTAILCFILRRKLSLWLDEPCFSWLYLFFKIRCCNANSKQIKSSSDCTPQLHFLFFFNFMNDCILV